MSISGSCLCGGVAFEIAGDMTPIQFCHAARCRKASGAAFAAEMLVKARDLSWTRGGELIATYEAPILKTPPAYRRCFCRTCGSPLPAAIEGTPYLLLNPGVLDDDPQTRPFQHAFVAQQAPWHEITDDMPKVAGQPEVNAQSLNDEILKDGP